MPDDLSRVREDRMPQPIRDILIAAVEETQRRGDPAVAPEHLMLAIAAESDSRASAVLADFGLDHDALDRALDVEVARSLAVIGIDELDPALLTATNLAATRPSWGSTTREVFRRAQVAGGRRRGRSAELDVLYGIVTANVGTVPRALEYAGVDRDALIGRVERERLVADDDPQRGAQGLSAQERQAMRRDAQRRMQDARRQAQRDAQARRRETQRTARAPQRESPAADSGRGSEPDADSGPTSD
ncbi:Clp protease N-terminal domain-containing protein [Rathayibacter sp. CAU 1779]